MVLRSKKNSRDWMSSRMHRKPVEGTRNWKLGHWHHIVQGLVQFFRNISEIHFFVHQWFKKTINSGFELVNRSFSEFSSGISQFEFFLITSYENFSKLWILTKSQFSQFRKTTIFAISRNHCFKIEITKIQFWKIKIFLNHNFAISQYNFFQKITNCEFIL